MKKYPKKLWALMWTSGSFSAYTDHKTAGNGSKCYHLHPGNEVARAQIIKDLNYLYECPSRMGAAMVAKRFGVEFKERRFV